MGTNQVKWLREQLDGQGILYETVEARVGVIDAPMVVKRAKAWVTQLWDGSIWVVKNQSQRERIIEDRRAFELFEGLLDGSTPWRADFIEDLGSDHGIRRAVVDRHCRERGYYIDDVADEADGLQDQYLRYCGKEYLTDDERRGLTAEMEALWDQGVRNPKDVFAFLVPQVFRVTPKAFDLTWSVFMHRSI